MIKGAIGLAAFGAGAFAASALVVGNKRVDAWETLAPEDAGVGDFVTLSDGARMHYVVRRPSTPRRSAQDAQDVILIHGLMDSALNWSKNIDALAQTYRVWAIDLIGFGFSSRMTAPTYSLKYFARTVREFMDAQGIERANIVGHSLGGAVALELALDEPQRVERLILIAPGTYVVNLPFALNLAARVPYIPRALVGMAMTSTRARLSAQRNALGNPAHFDPQAARQYTRPLHVKGTADALVAMAASPRASDLPAGLKNIAAPTLILWGDKDLAVPVKHGGHHERNLPNAEFVILEGAGHTPQLEYPDVVNRLVVDFLAREEKPR
jgi:pimeloyl-ACP methyl ester carboxylesterase